MDGNLVVWATTYKEKIGVLGPQLGLQAAEIQELQDAAQSVIESINRVDVKRVELREATAAKELEKRARLQLIRASAVRIRTLPGYNHNLGKELGIVSGVQVVDSGSIKPSLTATVFPGYVQLNFNKYRMFGISLYSRLKGELEWQALEVAKSSPYIDASLLTEAGKPETREYMGICYDGLQETGYTSDIVSVVYGG